MTTEQTENDPSVRNFEQNVRHFEKHLVIVIGCKESNASDCLNKNWRSTNIWSL